MRKSKADASVPTAPVASKAIRSVVASGRAEPVTLVQSEPGPPIELGAPASTASRTASIHHVIGIASPIACTNGGRTASGKTTPQSRNSAPATASGYDHASWRDWRHTAAIAIPSATIETKHREALCRQGAEVAAGSLTAQ